MIAFLSCRNDISLFEVTMVFLPGLNWFLVIRLQDFSCGSKPWDVNIAVTKHATMTGNNNLDCRFLAIRTWNTFWAFVNRKEHFMPFAASGSLEIVKRHLNSPSSWG